MMETDQPWMVNKFPIVSFLPFWQSESESDVLQTSYQGGSYSSRLDCEYSSLGDRVGWNIFGAIYEKLALHSRTSRFPCCVLSYLARRTISWVGQSTTLEGNLQCVFLLIWAVLVVCVVLGSAGTEEGLINLPWSRYSDTSQFTPLTAKYSSHQMFHIPL